MPVIEGKLATFTVNGIPVDMATSAAILEEPYSLEWHPRAYPCRLRKEQWQRQQRITELSCDNQIRRLHERLRGVTNPLQRGTIEHMISLLHAMRFPLYRWAEEIL